MTSIRWPLACLIPCLLIGLAGCRDQAGGTAAPGGDATAVPGDADTTAVPVPQITSGTVQIAPTTAAAGTPAAQATSEGRRRTVPLAEAEAKVPFTLLEPTFLPEGTSRGSVVHLMEPMEGQEADYLPAVRFIYDIENGSSLIILQSPARDLVIEGARTLELDGRTVYVVPNGDQTILVWEQDGVNFELRASFMPIQRMLDIARSMAPLGSPTAMPPGQAPAATAATEAPAAAGATEAAAPTADAADATSTP